MAPRGDRYERLRVTRYTGLDLNTAKLHMDEGAGRITHNFDFRRIGAARVRPGYSRVVVRSLAKSSVASDDFNRANGALGANWTAALGTAPVIVSNQAVGPGVNQGIAMRAAGTYLAGQYSRVSFVSASFFTGAAVRVSASGAYVFENLFGLYLVIVKVTSTSDVQISPTVARSLAANDTIELHADGDHLSGYVNDALVVEAFDSTFTTGRPGIRAGTSGDKLDNWEGGSLVETHAPAVVTQRPSRIFAFERDDDETRLIVAHGTRLEQFGEILPEWGT